MISNKEILELLKEIANSDMAMREEDEGNVSPLLSKVRATISTMGGSGSDDGKGLQNSDPELIIGGLGKGMSPTNDWLKGVTIISTTTWDHRTEYGFQCGQCGYDVQELKTPIKLCPKCNNQQREIPDTEEFRVSQSELDFALWHSVNWGFTPKHKEECYIRGKVFPPLKAVYDAEYAVFHVGDGEIRLSEVQWQSVFPEPTIERAARNYFKAMNATREPVSVSLEKCAERAFRLVKHAMPINDWNAREIATAVLDAAKEQGVEMVYGD